MGYTLLKEDTPINAATFIKKVQKAKGQTAKTCNEGPKIAQKRKKNQKKVEIGDEENDVSSGEGEDEEEESIIEVVDIENQFEQKSKRACLSGANDSSGVTIDQLIMISSLPKN